MNKLLFLLIPVVLLAGCTTPAITYNYYNYDQIPVEPTIINPEWNVDISFSKTTLCVGDTVTGFIDSNIANGFCRIFIDTGTGWKTDSDVALDSNGDYSEARTVRTVGAVTLMAICSDAELKTFARRNLVTLTIEMCANPSSCCKYMTTYDCFMNVCPVGWNTIEVYSTDEQCHANCHATSQCTDTDGGNDIYNYGVCSDATHSIQDNCQSQTIVNENWCANGVCMGASLYCPTGYHCWDGACVLTQTACSGIIRPTSQTSCSVGVCSTGNCIYHPATLATIAYCNCE
jgi:hypothetical protein